jgi:hypothetical protein
VAGWAATGATGGGPAAGVGAGVAAGTAPATATVGATGAAAVDASLATLALVAPEVVVEVAAGGRGAAGWASSSGSIASATASAAACTSSLQLAASTVRSWGVEPLARTMRTSNKPVLAACRTVNENSLNAARGYSDPSNKRSTSRVTTAALGHSRGACHVRSAAAHRTAVDSAATTPSACSLRPLSLIHRRV